ncbi:FkbM family methyltransferase [Nocardia cyriacigeorgica]|uniref:FkbM family methyltransferase n=1 Tax=Nocardia cyriacigeorgica TaxID=135487 RepID=A0A5R8NEA6_9NOCA|nr:FkbM family methyltransferase [Nocardia cyriacigeorgica]TLF74051.1 FkbM family methyltransferase [Nocardia cyriacigeorgica]
MIVLTPNQRYRFHTRDGSPSDEAVIRETWVENVYRIHDSDIAHDGATFVDIGANIGAVTVYAASRNPRARVIAVEPEPDNLGYLRRNLATNEVGGQVYVVPVAVSAAAGAGWIAARHGNSALTDVEEPGSTRVHIVTLAELFDEHGVREADFLKIDVEGAEYDIIAGTDLATLWRIKAIALEFDAAADHVFGPMIAKLAKVFGIEILGSPERGGYIYGRRY